MTIEEKKAVRTAMGWGMTARESISFLWGTKQGLKDYHAGKLIPVGDGKVQLTHQAFRTLYEIMG